MSDFKESVYDLLLVLLCVAVLMLFVYIQQSRDWHRALETRDQKISELNQKISDLQQNLAKARETISGHEASAQSAAKEIQTARQIIGELQTRKLEDEKEIATLKAVLKEKDSEIQKLICLWNIKNGVAEAKDVALSTKKHRIAMVGKLDFVNEQFVDVTMAVLDSKGCAVVSQEMHGSFSKPEIKTMNTIQALMGPVMGMLDDTTKVLLRKKCKVFYKGSLQHPEVKKKGFLKRP